MQKFIVIISMLSAFLLSPLRGLADDSKITVVNGISYWRTDSDDKESYYYLENVPDDIEIINIPATINGLRVEGGLPDLTGNEKIREIIVKSDLISVSDIKDCPNLTHVDLKPENYVLYGYNSIPSDFCANCPKLSIHDIIALIAPECVEVVGERAFELEMVDGEPLYHDITFTVPTHVREFSWDGYAIALHGRLFAEVKIPYTENPLKNFPIGKVMNLERALQGDYNECHFYNDDMWFKYLTEIRNTEHNIGNIGLLNYYGEQYEQLKTISIANADEIHASINAPKLESIQIGHADFLYLDLQDAGQNFKTLDLGGVETASVIRLYRMPDASELIVIWPKVINQELTVENVGLKTIDLTSLNVMESIWYNCFSDNPNLELIKYPENYTGGVWYANNPKLKEVWFGGQVTAFHNSNNNLHDIVYSGTLAQWCNIDMNYYIVINNEIEGVLKDVDHLWYGHNSKMTYLTEFNTNGIETIGSYVFSGYKRLTNVHISSQTLKIGAGAFSYSSIKEVSIDKAEIGHSAFYKTPDLASITLGKDISKMYTDAFDKCGTNVSTVVKYQGTLWEWCNIEYIDRFVYNEYYTTYYNWDGLPQMWADGGFYINGTLVENLEFDRVPVTIPPYAFAKTKSLKSVVFNGAYPSVFARGCFENCPNLGVISLKSATKKPKYNSAGIAAGITVEESAFRNDVLLSQIGFMNQISRVGSYAFENTACYPISMMVC